MNWTMNVTNIILIGLIILIIIVAFLKKEKKNIEVDDAMLEHEELFKHAAHISRNHAIAKKAGRANWLLPRVEENFKYITSTYNFLNDEAREGRVLVPAAEWLLDNYYIIVEQVDDIKRSLTKSSYSQLPVLKNGYLKGYPRIFSIALELVSHTDGRTDEKTLEGFIEAYQANSPLLMDELWALAIMLRIALIENLRRVCEKITGTQNQRNKAEALVQKIMSKTSDEEDQIIDLVEDNLRNIEILTPSFIEYFNRKLRKKDTKISKILQILDRKLSELNTTVDNMAALEHYNQAASQVSIGNTFSSLRFIATLEWTEVFEKASNVENILRQDPSGIYSRMDFESRQLYRKKVRDMAKSYKVSEIIVARKAVECCQSEDKDYDRESLLHHVGYYLVGKGRRTLEKRINRNYGAFKKIKGYLRYNPSVLYFGSIITVTLALTILFAYYSYVSSSAYSVLLAVLAGLVVLVPVSDFSITLVNTISSRILKPQILPKLELREGIPQESAAMVIVPTLLTSESRVKELVGQLEVFYLANREKNLYFALVGDFKDADSKNMPQDNQIIETAMEQIKELNNKYSQDKTEVFFYFQRQRQFNKSHKKWMGWERKRGAIIELNDLLRGKKDTGYTILSRDIHALPHVKYIVTLDADTNLPMGAASRLIGTISHPLNRPVVQKGKQIVNEGYGILQPRINVSIISANTTLFSRIFAGEGGIDPYTTAVSDIYQDLFGEGIFTGKGIYDIDVFQEVLKNSIPDNTVLSHDLLEGSYARAGLVTDIEFVDGYPIKYNSYAMRQHRWVRGDWQLLPWLASRIKDSKGNTVKNPLSFISKWKIADNMRRSLLSPSLMLLVISGLVLLPGSSLVWLILALTITSMPLIVYLMNTLLSKGQSVWRGKSHSTVIGGFRAALLQSLIMFSFIPYQTYLMLDAVIRTITRVTVTKRNMLQWVTAADMEASLKNNLKNYITRMLICYVSGIAVLLLGFLFAKEVLVPAVLIFILWAVAPYIAYYISQPFKRKTMPLSSNDILKLRSIARKTWRYFEDFSTKKDNYLPADNFQEDPPKGVAHRTSPTNIGLLLAAILAARDLGYLSTLEMARRLNNTISTIERMKKWKGHLYNWYDTLTLEILRPSYISTVDSGNFVGYLMVLEQGLKEYMKKPLIDINAASGLRDTISLLNQEMDIKTGIVDMVRLERYISNRKVDVKEWKFILETLEREIEEKKSDKDFLWKNKALNLIDLFKKDLNYIMPMVRYFDVKRNSEASEDISHDQEIPSLQDLFLIYSEIIASCMLEARDIPSEIHEAFKKADETLKLYKSLTDRIKKLIDSTKFIHLYDTKRQLFSIGYNAEEGKLSKSYYDLLASEARQASFLAVVRGEVSRKHWFMLGRKLTRMDGYKGLVSWTGTMFEYLMPLLIMKNYENTLLDETYHFVVRNQKKYGQERNIPWGTSESAFYAFDINLNYQYKAFGVPGLGLKRGLEKDLVAAPYASVLALGVSPYEALQNIWRLSEHEGVEALYGFYEALDYTSFRLKKGEKVSLVKAFMAHHQGMSLLAVDNCINNNIMQDRFHRDPLVKSGELLLQERIPARVVFNKQYTKLPAAEKKAVEDEGEVIRVFGLPDSYIPQVHMLSNGSYSVMVTDGGSGFSKLYNTAISRWKESMLESSGMFVFVRNVSLNTDWSATLEPYNVKPEKYKVIFSSDKAEFFRKDGKIETRIEIVVSPEDNAEIRKVYISNMGKTSNILELTSYFEAVLAHPDEDIAHPAFSNLFIRTEYIPDFKCLLASRRPRSEKQKVIWVAHTTAVDGQMVGDIQYETDRMKFIGRNRNIGNPVAMDLDQPLSNTVGAVLDPVMSLRVRINVEPGQTRVVSFITAASDSRDNALELAEKYNNPKSVERAFEMAWTRSQIEARYFGFKSKEVEQYIEVLPAVVFLSPLRKALAEYIIRNNRGQSGLWPYGISGDMPIVLVIITSKDDIELVQWSLKAHEYWRMKGLNIDLVMLSEDEGSYTQPVTTMVKDAVSTSHARDIQDAPGGVFIRNPRLMDEDALVLLYSAARIVIKNDIDSLLEQIGNVIKENSIDESHYFSNKGTTALSLPEKLNINKTQEFSADNLEMFNGIGGFARDGAEYVMLLDKGRHTPAPWVNIISNGFFGFLVSESGSSYTWAENSRENKLTPWYNDPVTDPSGEIFYIRDEDNGQYWSATPMPIRQDTQYIIAYGFGYSVFEHNSLGISSKLTQFVPMDSPVKISIIELENTTDTVKNISITLYTRPVMGVHDRLTAPYIYTAFNEETGVLTVKNSFNEEFKDRIMFLSTSEKEVWFTGDRLEFMGKNQKSASPAAMKKNKLSGAVGAGLDPCAAIQVIVSLQPAEKKDLGFLLGQGRDMDEVVSIAEKYKDIATSYQALETAKQYWKEKLGTIQVSTPDKSMDILMNGRLLYQVISCRLWSRSAFYQSGGAYGFRDQIQDVMSLVYTWPEAIRNQILINSSRQFKEGDVQHWWHAGTGKGIRTKYSDDLLWLPYVTADYIKCTGDSSLLDEEVTFLESEPLKEDEDERYETPQAVNEKATVYKHCVLAIERALKVGKHGIPLMGSGDWNDGMNTVGNKGEGESVWLGWFLYTVLKNFAPVCTAKNDEKRAKKYITFANSISKAIEENAWDGSWYRRAYFDDGTPLGSVQNSECSIDSISQSWSAISGAGNRARVEESMNAVEKYLIDRDEGIIKLLTPPFDEGNLKPGYIKGYVPGVRENGGQYTHAAVWVIMAFASMGKGDKAQELFHLINPINHSRTSIEYSRYKVEPYVMAADVYAVHPHAGRGGWTWYTGAAGWMYRVGIEHILGVKKTGTRLVIDPCIPESWDGYRITYRYGKAIYSINITNPDRVTKGVKELRINGKKVKDNFIKLKDSEKEYKIEVIMGR